MSTSQDISTYQFQFNYTDPFYGDGFGFRVSGRSGFGDAEAFALEAAILAALGATAPLAPSSSLFKFRSVSTQYDTNESATPPSFT